MKKSLNGPESTGEKKLTTDHGGNKVLVNNSKNNINNKILNNIYFRFYQNCRRLRTKLINFKCNIVCFNYIFIVLIKTCLNAEISNGELNLSNYNIFRFDRNSSISSCSRGGGVLIGTRTNLPIHIISDTNESIEHIFISFILNGKKFLVGGVYLPPNSSSSSYETFMSTVENLLSTYTDHTFIFCGDFNLPDVLWSNDNNGPIYSSTSDVRINCIPKIFALNNFFQINDISNYFGSLLDLILVSHN